MEQGKKKALFSYIGWNVIGMIGVSCYILADTFLIARALGTKGLAALNFAIVIFGLINGVGLMLGVGGSILYTIRNGKREGAGNHVFTQTLYLGGIFATGFFVIGVVGATAVGKLLGASGETLPMTAIYLKTVLIGAPFFIFNHLLLGFVRNDGRPKLTMVAMVISSLANIVLDYLFIFPLGMGMFGAALATVLSACISLAILYNPFSKGYNFHRVRCVMDWSQMGKVLCFGFSTFIGELAAAVALLTFNHIILGLTGEVGVAAYGVVANVAIVVTAIFTGVAQGLQPLASESYAKGDAVGMATIRRYSWGIALMVATGFYLLLLVSGEQIVASFNQTGDLIFAGIALQGVQIYFVGYFFAGVNIVMAAFLSATACAKEAMLIALLRSSILLIPMALLLSSIWGMQGVWLGFVGTEFVVAGVTLGCILKKYNKYDEKEVVRQFT